MLPPFAVLVLTCVWTLGVAAAQTVRIVTGSGVALANAVAASTPGDVVLVNSRGPFEPFVLNVGITIDGPQGFVVQGARVATDLTIDIPAGQSARVRGCQFRPVFLGASWAGQAQVSGGNVVLEDCDIASARSGLILLAGARVGLVRCVVTGSLAAIGCTVFAADSQFTGYAAESFNAQADVGIILRGASLHGQRVTVRGGAAYFFASNAGTALTTDSPSVWLVNSTIAGGARALGTGGVGLHNTAASPVRLTRCTVTDGGGSTPIVGLADTNAPLLETAATPTSPRLGQPFSVACTARPAEPLALFVSTGLDVLSLAFLEQPSWVSSGVVALGGTAADGLGRARFDVGIPNDPALTYVTPWFHVVGSSSTPLQISVPTGGMLR